MTRARKIGDAYPPDHSGWAQKHVEKKMQALIDHLDLMVDEFTRIGNCPGATPEIIQLCQRGIGTTLQKVPVILQRDRLASALHAYRNAQRRMLEKWAEGDENVKRDLWQSLHACEAAATAALDGDGAST